MIVKNGGINIVGLAAFDGIQNGLYFGTGPEIEITAHDFLPSGTFTGSAPIGFVFNLFHNFKKFVNFVSTPKRRGGSSSSPAGHQNLISIFILTFQTLNCKITLSSNILSSFWGFLSTSFMAPRFFRCDCLTTAIQRYAFILILQNYFKIIFNLFYW